MLNAGGMKKTAPRNNAHAHPTESLLVMENLIVEYDPALATNTAASEETLNRQCPCGGRIGLPSDATKPWAGAWWSARASAGSSGLTAAGQAFRDVDRRGHHAGHLPPCRFVLATGYFSWPVLRRVRGQRAVPFGAPLFGQMLTDYEDHGGLRWSTKLKAIPLTFGLMAITVILAGPSLPLLLVVTVAGSLGIYLAKRIPTRSKTTARRRQASCCRHRNDQCVHRAPGVAGLSSIKQHWTWSTPESSDICLRVVHNQNQRWP